jgi:hypothetical protein
MYKSNIHHRKINLSDQMVFARRTICRGFWEINLPSHCRFKVLELALGLVLANVSVRVKVRRVLGTLQASGQIGPRA